MQVHSAGATDEPECRIEVRVASDGYPLHYRHWIPATTSRGWMLTLHGIQSHSGWYEASAREFAGAGWNVRVPDRRGSGLNSSRRGDVDHWLRLLNDVRHFLRDIEQEREQNGAELPVVLSGISWGAKLALLAAREQPIQIDGLALITPGFFPLMAPGWWNRGRITLARFLNLRRRRVPIPLDDPALFTTQAEQQQSIQDDELALHEMTLSFLFASQSLDRQARQLGSLPLPTALFLAAHDLIIDNRKTQRFVRKLAGSSLSEKVYFDGAHTLERDESQAELIRDWLAWANSISIQSA